MIFSSLNFLFIFFPITAILYNLNRNSRYRSIVLLAASLFFYAWGEPVFVFVLVLLAIFNWRAALLIEKNKTSGNSRRNYIVVISIIVNLIPMVCMKILTMPQWNSGFQNEIQIMFPNLSYPLGISFFTFSAISYLVDVNREEISADRSFLRTANYLVFFPKLLQGPIARFENFQSALLNPETDIIKMADGLRRFIIGMVKKVLIADKLAVVVSTVFEVDFNVLPTGLAWYGIVAYALQILFDFSGYTDMAIGLANFLGFDLPENFNFPYLSRSIAEFWRRWHMSLMNFFRSYIFMPLEIARRKEKIFRQQSNLLIIFLITGLWHGTSWNFILWGLYFGVIIVLESSFLSKWLKKTPPVVQHIYTLAMILLGWVFFKIEDISEWLPFLKALLRLNHPSSLYTLRTLNILMYIPVLIVGIFGSTCFFKRIYVWSRGHKALTIGMDIILVGLFILCAAVTITGSYQVFLYSEF